MSLFRSAIGVVVCGSLFFTSIPVCPQNNATTDNQRREPQSETWVLREDGIGPVKVGMSIAQLNAALGENFSMPKDKDEQACFYVKSKAHPKVAFMMEDGQLSRIDVDGTGIRTVKGVQVGDPESAVLRLYGQGVKVHPHKYTGPDGHYLTIHSPHDKYALRFETYKGKIQSFYAGRYESIQYIEGCA